MTGISSVRSLFPPGSKGLLLAFCLLVLLPAASLARPAEGPRYAMAWFGMAAVWVAIGSLAYMNACPVGSVAVLVGPIFFTLRHFFPNESCSDGITIIGGLYGALAGFFVWKRSKLDYPSLVALWMIGLFFGFAASR